MASSGWAAVRLLWLVLVLPGLSGCAETAAPDPTPTASAWRIVCEPCGVTIDASVDRSRWEPMVAVDPRDPDRLVASTQMQWNTPTGGRSWGMSHVSSDGGRTWTTHAIPGGPEGQPGHPLAHRTWMDDSVPAFLSDGTVLWSTLAKTAHAPPFAIAETGLDLLVMRGDGRTFEDPIIVGAGQGAYLVSPNYIVEYEDVVRHDKQWLVTDDDHVWMVWSENHVQTDSCPGSACTWVRSATSSDGGRTWTHETIDERIVSGAYPARIGDTRIVSTHDGRDGTVWLARSVADGPWDVRAVAEGTKFPMLAVDESTDRVWMVLPRGPHRDEAQDVALMWSDDTGISWSEPLLIAPTGPAGRTVPAVVAMHGGALVTYWQPGSPSTYEAAFVVNGTVAARLVLDSMEASSRDTGDYMGLARQGDGAYAVWTRNDGEGRVMGAALQIVAA